MVFEIRTGSECRNAVGALPPAPRAEGAVWRAVMPVPYSTFEAR